MDNWRLLTRSMATSLVVALACCEGALAVSFSQLTHSVKQPQKLKGETPLHIFGTTLANKAGSQRLCKGALCVRFCPFRTLKALPGQSWP